MVELLESAAALLGFDGDIVPGVRFGSSSCTAVVQLDEAEVERRAKAGLGSLHDYQLVEALTQLPLDCVIPWESVNPVVAAILDCAPPGVLRTDAHGVERLWRPALQVTGVMVASTNWQAGLEAVGVFAPDAPRGLLLLRTSQERAAMLAQARRFGIGVVTADPQGDKRVRLVLAPRPRRRPRSTARHWRFLEAVFSTWQAREEARYPRSAHACR